MLGAPPLPAEPLIPAEPLMPAPPVPPDAPPAPEPPAPLLPAWEKPPAAPAKPVAPLALVVAPPCPALPGAPAALFAPAELLAPADGAPAELEAASPDELPQAARTPPNIRAPQLSKPKPCARMDRHKSKVDAAQERRRKCTRRCKSTLKGTQFS